MPPDTETLSLAFLLTAAGVVPAAALVTTVVGLLSNAPFMAGPGPKRTAAFIASLALVVFAYVALPVTLTGVSLFAGFLAWIAIAKGSMAVYDEIQAKPGSLRGPSA